MSIATGDNLALLLSHTNTYISSCYLLLLPGKLYVQTVDAEEHQTAASLARVALCIHMSLSESVFVCVLDFYYYFLYCLARYNWGAEGCLAKDLQCMHSPGRPKFILLALP